MAEPETVGRSFGSLLRKYRARAGFSQRGLAEKAAISSAAVGALEQGKRRAPYAYTVGRLADALDLGLREREAFEDVATRSRGRARVKSTAGSSESADALPVSLAQFIDRPEVDELADLIDDSRFVTVTGPGGIGKTRTAIEATRRSKRYEREAVRFLDLSVVGPGDDVVGRLAAALGQRATSNEDRLSRVIEAFASQQTLLLLDNCEHLLEAVANLVDVLVKSCSGLTILATSREPLGLSIETTYRLPSLRTPHVSIASLSEARSYAALDLFMTRARVAAPRVALSSDHIGLMTNICNQLDGMPLAIELAVARLSTIGLETLASRIDNALKTPAGRDRPIRQQTMDATIDWSYRLLVDPERILLRRLCVFAGGFTLEAAEQVCADELLPESSIERHLSQLVLKSLVNARDPEHSTRYTLLEPIRAFSWQRLVESGESGFVIRRHAAWLAALADYVFGKRRIFSSMEYLSECENAVIAIERCASSTGENALLAARIIVGFRLLLPQAFTRDALLRTANLLLSQIDERREPLIALRLIWLLLLENACSEQAELQQFFARALQLCESLGNDDDRVSTYHYFAMSFYQRGSPAFANDLMDRADALYRHGSVTDGSYGGMLISRAWIRSVEGRLDEARTDLQLLMRLTRERPGNEERINGLITLAEIECAAERYDLADRYCTEVLNGSPRIDQRLTALCNLAAYKVLQGDAARAQTLAREALRFSLEKPEGTIVVQHFATAAALSGDSIFAARLLGYVDDWFRRDNRARLGVEQRGYEVLIGALKESLTEGDLRVHMVAGALAGRATLVKAILKT